MFAENDRVLSRVTPRFFSLWEGDTVESTGMERKSNSVLSRLRWRTDIQAEIYEKRVATWVSEGVKEKSSCVICIAIIGETM
jgi:hypothetical protein